MSAIHTDGLPRLDLNLLVAFDLLVQERSVTKAAERAGVTQSAMSHTLRRLREAFGDELLVRGGGGMLLTPRAEKLIGPIRTGLVALERAVHEPDRFDPDRFSPERAEDQRHTHSWVPFGGGSHMCLYTRADELVPRIASFVGSGSGGGDAPHRQ